MIVHMSIPAQSPRETAKALGEMLGGPVVQFVPGGKEAFMAYAGDGSYLIEVLPLSSKHVPGLEEGEAIAYGTVQRPVSHEFYSFHLACCTAVPYHKILGVCAMMGWRCVESWRGAAFKVLEVWIENYVFMELMSAEDAERYVRTMGDVEGWKAGFELRREDDGVYVADADSDIVRFVQTQGRHVTLP